MKNRIYDGPTMSISQELDKMKYRQEGESFHDKVMRIAGALCDDDEHQFQLQDILGEMRFLTGWTCSECHRFATHHHSLQLLCLR